jgi:hypothetical protein
MNRARVLQIFLTVYNPPEEERDVICHCEKRSAEAISTVNTGIGRSSSCGKIRW